MFCALVQSVLRVQLGVSHCYAHGVVATQYQMSVSMLGPKTMSLGAILRELCKQRLSRLKVRRR